LRGILRKLEDSGEAQRLRKNRWAPVERGEIVVGRLSVNPRGFGMVQEETEPGRTIHIHSRALGPAIDRDRVSVKILPSGRGREKGADGRVLRVLERTVRLVPGLLKRTPYYAYVIPDNPRLLETIRVTDPPDPGDCPPEDHKVVVRLDEPGAETAAGAVLTGRIVEDLGHADDPGVDMLCILRDHQIAEPFPDPVRERADALADHPPPPSPAGRLDLRGEVAFTIDPPDAKDFDDAVSLRLLPDGTRELGVHIADVPAYVEPGSAIDEEARRRGTSVYLVDRVVTMLPRNLTTDVCSLRPDEDRLTHSVLMTFDAAGRLRESRTARSVIRSRARLTYDEVQAWFDERGDSIPELVREPLAAIRELARQLRAGRRADGALLFHQPEIRCELDREGDVRRIVKRGESEAYQLIEECMLAANRVVAHAAQRAEAPSVYRVHDEPDEEQWGAMADQLRALGVAETPGSRADLNRIAAQWASSDMAFSVNLSILRHMKRAVYTAECRGHFGLAFDAYTHFTSPIRRYPDLVVHRMLCALEDGRPPPYSIDEVRQIALHCSDTEREADRAETESVELKRIQYYLKRLWAGDTGPHEAIVVNVFKRGLLVELPDTLQRGLVSFRDLRDDHYHVDEDRLKAVGRRTGKTWTLGSRLRVLVARVDEARRQVDFVPEAAETSSAGFRPRSKGRRRKRR